MSGGGDTPAPKLAKAVKACYAPGVTVPKRCQIQSLAFAATLLLAPPSAAYEAPAILVQPEDQTGLLGSTVHLEAAVAGSPPPQLQWRAYLGATFTNIPGATESTLTLPNLQVPTRPVALFAVNDHGAVTSRLASVTVLRPAGFARDPASVIAVEGQTTSISLVGVGTAPVRYQWHFEGQPIPGKTAPVLSLPRVSRTNEGDYYAVATNAYGMATSRVACLRVTPAPGSLEARVQPEDAPFQLRYRLFVPPAARQSTTARYPLVLTLHGSGERGSDNLSQLSAWPQSLVFVSFTNQARFPAFLVAPQCPQGWDWTQAEMSRKLSSLLDSLMTEFPIDPDRISITGLSMGGFAAWELPRQWRSTVAATIPICGGGTPSQAADLKELAIWNFHSATDPLVPIGLSREMVHAVRAAGGRPIYTEYADGGHAIWANAWATPGLVEWTFGQRRGQQSTAAPDLEITSHLPGEPVTAVGTTRLSIKGTARILDGRPGPLTWTNLTTQAGGSGVGALAWNLDDIPLSPGVTNHLLVIGSTDSFAPGLGGVTTVNDARHLVYQPPAQVTATVENGVLRIAWNGGVAPYTLQTSTGLDSGLWANAVINAVPPVEIPLVRAGAFYRVVSGTVAP